MTTIELTPNGGLATTDSNGNLANYLGQNLQARQVSQPINVVYSQTPEAPKAPTPAIWVQRQPRYFNAYKLSPDNPWRILHIPGAILYSLFSQPKGSLMSIGILFAGGVCAMFLLSGAVNFLWASKVEYRGPGHRTGETAPDVSKYLPTIDVK